MGFVVYYRSTRLVTDDEAAALQGAADEASKGRTWLSCESPRFYDDRDLGRIWGGSKPNFTPDPADAASAAEMGLPDGDLHSLVEVLSLLSRQHGIDWEFRHDEMDWSVGSIRDGVADEDLLGTIDALTGLAEALREMEEFGDDFS